MTPEDTNRLAAYGELAGGAQAAIRSRTPGDPREVADAIVALVETPIGQRPLRTLTGQGTEPLAATNAASDKRARSAFGGSWPPTHDKHPGPRTIGRCHLALVPHARPDPRARRECGG